MREEAQGQIVSRGQQCQYCLVGAEPSFSCAAASKYLPARPDVVRTLEADRRSDQHQSAVALRPVTHPSEREQSLLLFLLFLQFGTLAISFQRPVSESKVTRNNSDLL